MAFLSSNDVTEIKRLFEKLSADVRLIYFTQRESPPFVPGQECETCKDTRLLLEEIAGLSDKIHLDVHDFVADGEMAREYGIDRIPTLVLSADGVKGQIRYFGMPSGYEFSVLLGSLLDASQGTSALSEETVEVLQGLDRDLHIQVFVTPT